AVWPALRADSLRDELIEVPSFRDEELGAIGVEDLGGAAALGPVATEGALEVVEAEPGLKVGVDVLGRGVEAVAEGRAVVQVEHRALEALHERVQIRRSRRQLVAGDPEPHAGPAEL